MTPNMIRSLALAALALAAGCAAPRVLVNETFVGDRSVKYIYQRTMGMSDAAASQQPAAAATTTPVAHGRAAVRTGGAPHRRCRIDEEVGRRSDGVAAGSSGRPSVGARQREAPGAGAVSWRP